MFFLRSGNILCYSVLLYFCLPLFWLFYFSPYHEEIHYYSNAFRCWKKSWRTTFSGTIRFASIFCWLAMFYTTQVPQFLCVEIAITWVFLFCLGWHFWAPLFERKKVFHERFYESTHWLRRKLQRKFSTFFQSDTMVKDSVKFLVDAMMKQDDSIDSIASKDASNQKDVEEVTLKDSNHQEKVSSPLCLC